MNVITPENGRKPIKMWTDGVPLEDSAKEQLLNVASLPFVYRHVAVMPDVHWGMGATVGSVIPTRDAIVPAAVGVDIGCGMMALQTRLTSADLTTPSNLRSVIEAAVPHGRTDNGGRNDKGRWNELPDTVKERWDAELADGFKSIVGRHPKIEKSNHVGHLGTLGTGNHFIEICLDEKDRVWIMLHSGSRGVGNKIGSYFINLAKTDMKTWMIRLPDPNLAYLPKGTEHFSEYLEAVNWAQNYARINRELMMRNVQIALSAETKRDCQTALEVINCHHNYVAMENHFGDNVWVTRKGAVRARKGDMGIIPGSMGAKSFITEGKGNPESFDSCSHGAGRAMSRTAAKKRFTVEDHARATDGVECRKDADVLDETPGSYKDIDAVMRAQADLVDIKHTLRQIVCVKG